MASVDREIQQGAREVLDHLVMYTGQQVNISNNDKQYNRSVWV